MIDKFLIEVCKPKELFHLLGFCWSWLLFYTFELDRVHKKLIWFDNESEVFEFLDTKDTFLWFAVQVMLL
jgi:hypothetical protein